MISSDKLKYKFSKSTTNVFLLACFFLLISIICVFYMSSLAFSSNSLNDEPVVINTSTGAEYDTLKAAVLDAKLSEVVEIQKAGKYVVDCFREDFWVPNHITISAKESLDSSQVILDGICYEEAWKSDYPIFSAPNGVNFKNITLDVGNHAYHGFWHATQAINFEECIINGWFWTSIDTTFTNCNFYQASSDNYCVYTYSGNNISFDGCYFNAYGRFVNVYKDDCHSITNVDFNNCQFESNKLGKSAINVKASDGWPLEDHMLNWNVKISGCSTIGENFPTENRLNSKLVMIDDGNSPGISISLADSSGNPSVIYPPPPEYYVLTVGEGKQLHTSLEADSTYESLTWESLTPEVVTVSPTGHIDQVKSGFARITAKTSQTHMVAEFNVSFPCFKFHMNGHGDQIPDIYTEPYDSERQPLLKPTDPVAEGFTFEGWYTDEALTNLYTWDKIQTVDLDLYAKWKSNVTPLKINLEQDDVTKTGTEEIYVINGVGYYSDKDCTKAISAIPVLPEKDGYNFSGYWTNEQENNEPSLMLADSNGVLETTYTLFSNPENTAYAYWTEAPTPPPDPPQPPVPPEPSPEISEYLDAISATGDFNSAISMILAVTLFISSALVVSLKKDRSVRR